MKIVQKLFNLQTVVQENEEGEIKVDESWPQKGLVEFKNVHLRYRPTTDLVLNGINFKINAGDKVGVIGRTGAGKSTLGLTLLKIVEAEAGSVLIDGIDIGKIDLQVLREKVTIIP